MIEYSESKDESQVSQLGVVGELVGFVSNRLKKLLEANRQLMEGLTLDGKVSAGSKDHVTRRQLQAKMVMELMEMDKEQAKKCLRLWKEMSDVFVEIRDMDFATLDYYLKFRVVDAGCPYVPHRHVNDFVGNLAADIVS